jgi:MFS family permease
MEELIIKSILLGLVAGLRPILIPVLLAILANKVHARPRGLVLIGGAAAGMAVQCLVAGLISEVLPRWRSA